MYHQCERPECTHYAMHFVSTAGRGPKIRVCHLCVSWALSRNRKRSWWSRVEVATHSAVVEGDIWAWRTRSITAYDEFRQIGA